MLHLLDLLLQTTLVLLLPWTRVGGSSGCYAGVINPPCGYCGGLLLERPILCYGGGERGTGIRCIPLLYGGYGCCWWQVTLSCLVDLATSKVALCASLALAYVRPRILLESS